MYFKRVTISFVSVTVIKSSLKSFGQTRRQLLQIKVLHNDYLVEGKGGGYHK